MLQKSSTERVLKIFFRYPFRKLQLRELSRYTGLAHTSVLIALKRLESEGLINITKKQQASRICPEYQASLTDLYRKLKKISNYEDIIESGLVERLEEFFMPKVIVLFGSFCKGEDDETSDIDLFTQAKEESIDLSEYEKRFGRKIQLHFQPSFLEYPDELKNSILNGIVLSGYLNGYQQE
jgi:predicted nucleotidyltransferase